MSGQKLTKSQEIIGYIVAILFFLFVCWLWSIGGMTLSKYFFPGG